MSVPDIGIVQNDFENLKVMLTEYGKKEAYRQQLYSQKVEYEALMDDSENRSTSYSKLSRIISELAVVENELREISTQKSRIYNNMLNYKQECKKEIILYDKALEKINKLKNMTRKMNSNATFANEIDEIKKNVERIKKVLDIVYNTLSLFESSDSGHHVKKLGNHPDHPEYSDEDRHIKYR